MIDYFGLVKLRMFNYILIPINPDWLWLTTIHLSQARLLAAAAATVTMPCCAKGTERLERAAPSGAQRPSWHHRGSRSPGAGCCVEETKDLYIYTNISIIYLSIYPKIGVICPLLIGTCIRCIQMLHTCDWSFQPPSTTLKKMKILGNYMDLSCQVRMETNHRIICCIAPSKEWGSRIWAYLSHQFRIWR